MVDQLQPQARVQNNTSGAEAVGSGFLPVVKSTPQIRIKTKFGTQLDTSYNNPLIISMAQCSEGIAKPYSIDILVVSPSGLVISKSEMLNTVASVFFRFDFQGIKYAERKGVFESFGRPEPNRREGAPNIKMFNGRIVPAFKLMDQEILFRTFQHKTAIEIIKECFNAFPGRDLSSYLDTSKIEGMELPKLEYCVQFGESTLNFVSRLMASFGISYFFDHERAGELETMVLCRGPITANDFKSCTSYDNDVFFVEKPDTVAKFDRKFGFPVRAVSVGAFNTVVPTRPILTQKTLNGNVPLPNIVEEFPHPFITNSEQASAAAEVNLEIGESQASIVTGTSKNATFAAAKTFHTREDRREVRVGGNLHDGNKIFLITDFSCHAYERGFLSTVGTDLFTFFIDDTLPAGVRAFAGESIDAQNPDLASAMSAAGLNNYLKSYLQTWSQTGTGPTLGNVSKTTSVKDASGHSIGSFSSTTNGVGLSSYFFAGAVAYLTALINPESPLFSHFIAVLVDIVQIISDIVGFIVALVTIVILVPFLPILLIAGQNPIAFSAKILRKENEIRNSFNNTLEETFKAKAADYSNSIVALCLSEFDAEKVRINLPLPAAVKPFARGPHLATVVGNKGVDTSEGTQLVDAFGRVRIRFPWDRHVTPGSPAAGAGDLDAPQFSTSENAAWVRVSESWAGQQFGTQFLPRIGDEVIVDFIDGDPDQPIITGRVYNARGTSIANLPFPTEATVSASSQIKKPEDLLNLTANPDYFHRSGIKTRSMRTAANEADNHGFHLLRFDDTVGKEQFLIRSQRRLDITALEKRYESIHSDRHLTVGGKKLTPPPKEIGGDYIAKVFRHYHLHVGDPDFPTESGNRRTLIEQNDELKVVRDANQIIGGNWSTAVGGLLAGQVTINAQGPSGIIVLNADQNISLTVGMSSIVITPSAIAITSPSVLINSGGPMPELPIPPEVDPPAPPTNADPGDTLTPPE